MNTINMIFNINSKANFPLLTTSNDCSFKPFLYYLYAWLISGYLATLLSSTLKIEAPVLGDLLLIKKKASHFELLKDMESQCHFKCPPLKSKFSGKCLI